MSSFCAKIFCVLQTRLSCHSSNFSSPLFFFFNEILSFSWYYLMYSNSWRCLFVWKLNHTYLWNANTFTLLSRLRLFSSLVLTAQRFNLRNVCRFSFFFSVFKTAKGYVYVLCSVIAFCCFDFAFKYIYMVRKSFSRIQFLLFIFISIISIWICTCALCVCVYILLFVVWCNEEFCCLISYWSSRHVDEFKDTFAHI